MGRGVEGIQASVVDGDEDQKGHAQMVWLSPLPPTMERKITPRKLG